MRKDKPEAIPEAKDIISTEDGSYRTTFTEKYRNRVPWTKPDPRQIFSFIPGTITTINVTPGQKVKVGDILVTFKAMKMINVYNSPIAGTIARIHVQTDQIVPKGVMLLEFE